jgi:hypothetical protein
MKQLIALSASLLVLLAAASVWPFDTAVVSEWRVQVKDEVGKPLTGLVVSQYWQHYWVSAQEERLTDAAGFVTFPERRVRACFVKRLFTMLTVGMKMSFLERA